MSFKKWIAFLTAGTLAVGAVTVGTSAAETQADAADNTYKIMCVGDSITHGYINGDNGYRKYLCHYLQQNDISYDMVGPENSWSNEATYNWNGTTITYDPAHCGYSGYAIRQYSGRYGIYETLFSNGNQIETYDPDIVLLMIGTNDLLDARFDKTTNVDTITDSASALERLEYLVDEVLSNLDSTDTLFLASVPDIDAEIRADWLGAYGYIAGVDTSDSAALKEKVDSCVDAYNVGVKTLVNEKKSAGYKVEFCDINSVVDVKAGLDDGVHPNEAGYAEMGLLWANTISSYLGENPIETTPGTTTTTTATTTVSVDCESSTASTTTTTETTKPTTTTVATTIPSSEGDIHLTDVVIGETYDLSDYDGITGISVVFDSEDEYIGGKFVLGNWAVQKDYSAADLVNNTLTVEVEDEYDQMTVYRWNGTAGIKEVILHFADSETTTETTSTEKTTTTTEETTAAITTTTTVTTTTVLTTDDTQPTTTKATTTESTTKATTTESTTKATTTESTTKATTTESTTKATTTTATDDKRIGDVNGDDAVSLLDVVYLRKYIAGSISKEGVILENCDMDNDGKVNIFDTSRLIMYIIEAI